MKSKQEKKLLVRIRILIVLFIFCLIISGITAFPIKAELSFAVNHISLIPDFMRHWIKAVYAALKTTNANYPFLSYGTDWLAFAHIVIAVVFIGPFLNPVKNIWVIQFGIIACLMILPMALIAGPIRGIPLYWLIIDCSFGVIGFIPLYICYRMIKKLEKLVVVSN